MEQLEGCYGCRSLARLVTEADATIAALQARVKELEARQHFGACAKCLTNAWRICKEGTPDAVEMKCSNGSTWWLCDYCLSKEQLTQRTAELEAAKQWKLQLCNLTPGGELCTLIAALPKVEGEIAVKHTEVDLSGVWGITLNGYFTFQSALFDSKEEADAYAALLTRRQGME